MFILDLNLGKIWNGFMITGNTHSRDLTKHLTCDETPLSGTEKHKLLRKSFVETKTTDIELHLSSSVISITCRFFDLDDLHVYNMEHAQKNNWHQIHICSCNKKKLKKNLVTLEDYIYTQNNTILAYQSLAQYHIQTWRLMPPPGNITDIYILCIPLSIRMQKAHLSCASRIITPQSNHWHCQFLSLSKAQKRFQTTKSCNWWGLENLPSCWFPRPM